MREAWPWRKAVVDLLARTRLAQPDELAPAVNAALRPLGLEMTVYLVDQEQRFLRPLPEPGKPLPEPLPVEGTLAGRAFTSVRAVPAAGGRGEPDRLWLPLLDGTERLGVVHRPGRAPGDGQDALRRPVGAGAPEPAHVRGVRAAVDAAAAADVRV
jgi:hypothetical protein